MAVHPTHTWFFFKKLWKIGAIIIKLIVAGQKTMFSLRKKCRLMKKSVNLNKYSPFFIIFPIPVMLKFTVPITAVHLFTCVAKAVTSRRSREFWVLRKWFGWFRCGLGWFGGDLGWFGVFPRTASRPLGLGSLQVYACVGKRKRNLVCFEGFCSLRDFIHAWTLCLWWRLRKEKVGKIGKIEIKWIEK